MTDWDVPLIDDLRSAHQRIAGHVHRTPVMSSRLLDDGTARSPLAFFAGKSGSSSRAVVEP